MRGEKRKGGFTVAVDKTQDNLLSVDCAEVRGRLSYDDTG